MISNINYEVKKPLEIQHVKLEDMEFFLGSDDEILRVYLVRHGESALNVAHEGVTRVQGQSPWVPLTKKGEEQADILAKKMIPKMSHLTPRLISSTAKRAIDTAQILAFGLETPLASHEEFLELGSGIWEGVDKEDPGYVKDYSKWKNLSAHQKFFSPKVSTGQSYSEVAKRALKGVSSLFANMKEGETLFIYTHLMLMNAVAISLNNLELSQEEKTSLPDLDIHNGDILMVEIPRGMPMEQGYVRSVIHTHVK